MRTCIILFLLINTWPHPTKASTELTTSISGVADITDIPLREHVIQSGDVACIIYRRANVFGLTGPRPCDSGMISRFNPHLADVGRLNIGDILHVPNLAGCERCNGTVTSNGTVLIPPLNNSLEELQKKLESVTKQRDYFQQQNLDMSKGLEGLQKTNEALENENQSLREENEVLENENQSLREENEALMKEMQKLRNSIVWDKFFRQVSQNWLFIVLGVISLVCLILLWLAFRTRARRRKSDEVSTTSLGAILRSVIPGTFPLGNRSKAFGRKASSESTSVFPYSIPSKYQVVPVGGQSFKKDQLKVVIPRVDCQDPTTMKHEIYLVDHKGEKHKVSGESITRALDHILANKPEVRQAFGFLLPGDDGYKE